MHQSASAEPSRAGVVAWITGLPAAGKSTFAGHARARLDAEGVAACILDGDAVRQALVPPPGYTPEARAAFYETLARLAALLARQGLVVLVAATAHRRAYRALARQLAPAYLEVWVRADADTVRSRNPKGLYAASAARALSGLPGADVPYEPPAQPEVIANGGVDEAALNSLCVAVRRVVG